MSDITEIEGIPEPLERFIIEGGTTFRCDDGDWVVQVEYPVPKFLHKDLPLYSLVIANNECGDYLFLQRRDESGSSTGPFMDSVFVYWHESPEIQEFCNNLLLLTNPPPPVPTKHPQVFYSDGTTEVKLGDHVSARDLIFRKEGRVAYLPCVSKKNRELEHYGLAWVGIRFDGGSVTGGLVDPESNLLKKSIRFLSRATTDVEEIGPYEDLE